nr:MAG TPA: hypothetical protein [Caudoviricetes sp.]DAN97450.1 MAG TPA: hypothetical protein [Caudoviricetes sp.]DAU20129.1 MAG TPA: hypothetical protein [Caudoviricetes sp.]
MSYRSLTFYVMINTSYGKRENLSTFSEKVVDET